MTYDTKLVKIITGETVIGKIVGDKIEDPAIIQTVPTQQGVQMMLVPYGYPFQAEMTGSIDAKNIIFEYDKCPEELTTKYIEALTNITLSSGGIDPTGGMGGGGSSNSGLIL